MLFLPLIITGTFLLVFFDYHKTTKNFILEKYDKFKELNSAVDLKYKNKCKSFLVSTKMIFEMLHVSFVQYLIKTIEHKDKNTVILSYSLKGHLYKIILIPKKGPSSIFLITDENNKDVTCEITPFLGPQEDWHGHFFTPKYWNMKKLNFEMKNFQSLVFSEDEIIDLNLKN